MRISKFTVVTSILLVFATATATAAAKAPDVESQVRAASARFWQAYNACDMKTMGDLVTVDVEFYHDKTGLTTSRQALMDSLRKGPCADPGMRLRREAVDESIRYHPLEGGYAIMSGRHRFYVREAGKPEHLDGQAAFATVWKFDGGRWRMHRVLSYDHGPVPYTPPPRTLSLSPTVLQTYASRYSSPRVGDILITVDGDHLKLTAGSFVATLYPQSSTRFFAMERDIRFEFEIGANGAPESLAVYENGALSERAARAK